MLADAMCVCVCVCVMRGRFSCLVCPSCFLATLMIAIAVSACVCVCVCVLRMLLSLLVGSCARIIFLAICMLTIIVVHVCPSAADEPKEEAVSLKLLIDLYKGKESMFERVCEMYHEVCHVCAFLPLHSISS